MFGKNIPIIFGKNNVYFEGCLLYLTSTKTIRKGSDTNSPECRRWGQKQQDSCDQIENSNETYLRSYF